MSVKAVAFDIDGTLYPNWSMYLNSIPFFLVNQKLVRAFNKVRHEIRFHDCDEGVHPESEECFSALQASLLAKELSLSDNEADELITRIFYGKWEKTFRRIRPFSGAAPLLQSIKDRGMKLGALSDFPVGRKLEYFGLDSYWDVVMASHESGALKPSEKPFLELARRLETDPSEILYVGNNPRYDVVGCRKAGMMSAYVAPPWKGTHSEADIQFSNYRQFALLLDRFLKDNSVRPETDKEVEL